MISSRMLMVRTSSLSTTRMTPVGQILAQVPQPMQRPSSGTTKSRPSRFTILRAPGPTISLQTRMHRRQRMQPSGRGPRSISNASAS